MKEKNKYITIKRIEQSLIDYFSINDLDKKILNYINKRFQYEFKITFLGTFIIFRERINRHEAKAIPKIFDKEMYDFMDRKGFKFYSINLSNRNISKLSNDITFINDDIKLDGE